jgi:hypothetical protein
MKTISRWVLKVHMMSNESDSHGIGDALKGTQENGWTCFCAICLQKNHALSKFLFITKHDTWTKKHENISKCSLKIEMNLEWRWFTCHRKWLEESCKKMM